MEPRRNRLAGLVSTAVIIAITGGLVLATSTDEAELHIPGAAHVTGSNNTVWRTDLELRSVSSVRAHVRIDLLRQNRDNTSYPSVTLEIEPGAAQRYEDAIELLFGYEGSATLRLVTLAGDLRATSRTYNETPDGTYGQFIGAVGSPGAFGFNHDATLIQLSSSSNPGQGFRTNIGLVNLVHFPINMEIDLLHADTRYLGRIETTLQPFDSKQINDAFSRVTTNTVEDGFAIVRATTFGGEYLTYASVIDNRTGDPIYLPGLPAGSDTMITPSPTTPTATPQVSPTPTPTATATPPGGSNAVEVTTLDEETFLLVPSTVRFRVGSGTQSSLVLCSFDGTLSQVSNSNFNFIRGPTRSVEWPNCCANFGARLEYETFVGLGGPAVARSTCTAGTPYFAILGTEVDTGASIEVPGENLDLAVWP